MTEQQMIVTVIGTLITFLMTAAGSALVFLIKSRSPKTNTIVLGFSSGVMIAASVWSLLLPSLEQAQIYFEDFNYIPTCVGFLLGGMFMVIADKLTHQSNIETVLRKPSKLFVAVLVHNIPEGLAVGFAFGFAMTTGSDAAYYSALALSVGIAIQNLPEGLAVALPFKSATNSRAKGFFYGVISGTVEPLFAVVGILMASFLTAIQPWLLAFSAGAMIFVVAEDLIPDSKLESNPKLGAWGVMLGFALMMILDVALG